MAGARVGDSAGNGAAASDRPLFPIDKEISLPYSFLKLKKTFLSRVAEGQALRNHSNRPGKGVRC
jgi:hypothetical protein